MLPDVGEVLAGEQVPRIRAPVVGGVLDDEVVACLRVALEPAAAVIDVDVYPRIIEQRRKLRIGADQIDVSRIDLNHIDAFDAGKSLQRPHPRTAGQSHRKHASRVRAQQRQQVHAVETIRVDREVHRGNAVVDVPAKHEVTDIGENGMDHAVAVGGEVGQGVGAAHRQHTQRTGTRSGDSQRESAQQHCRAQRHADELPLAAPEGAGDTDDETDRPCESEALVDIQMIKGHETGHEWPECGTDDIAEIDPGDRPAHARTLGERAQVMRDRKQDAFQGRRDDDRDGEDSQAV